MLAIKKIRADRNVDFDAVKEACFSHACGKDWKQATNILQQISDTFGRHELEIERYYDHSLACRVLAHITRKPEGNIILD